MGGLATDGSETPHLTQPRGPSFQIDGNAVTWQRWHFRVGWTPRDVMVLYQIGYDDNRTVRPVIYRLSRPYLNFSVLVSPRLGNTTSYFFLS